MHIFLQGEDNKVKRKLGLTDNTMITVEPTARAKNNEYVFYKTDKHGGMDFKRYKKIKHLEVEVYAIVNIWNEDTKRILKRFKRK